MFGFYSESNARPSGQVGNARFSVFAGLILTLAVIAGYYTVDLRKPPPDAGGGGQKQGFAIHSSTDTGHLFFIKSSYSVDRLDSYRVSAAEGVEYDLSVARYRDEDGSNRQAIVYLPAETDEDGKVSVAGDRTAHFRYEKWMAAAEAINKYTDAPALFVSFWDNGQRINLFTKRRAWITLPDRDAYSTREERQLWESVAGGFDTEGRSAMYSRWLLMDMDAALLELTRVLPDDRDIYLLAGTDDLAHIQEVAILSGRSLPLETRLFSKDADLHSGIARVKEWAREDGGTGSYLVQSVSYQFIRVWRITDPAFEDTLLARLLPFTSSFNKPFKRVRLIYQSDVGAYISLYQLMN